MSITTNECSRSCCCAGDDIRSVKLSRIEEKLLRVTDKDINAAFFSRFWITEIMLGFNWVRESTWFLTCTWRGQCLCISRSLWSASRPLLWAEVGPCPPPGPMWPQRPQRRRGHSAPWPGPRCPPPGWGCWGHGPSLCPALWPRDLWRRFSEARRTKHWSEWPPGEKRQNNTEGLSYSSLLLRIIHFIGLTPLSRQTELTLSFFSWVNLIVFLEMQTILSPYSSFLRRIPMHLFTLTSETQFTTGPLITVLSNLRLKTNSQL